MVVYVRKKAKRNRYRARISNSIANTIARFRQSRYAQILKTLFFRVCIWVLVAHLFFIGLTSSLIFAYKFINPTVSGVKVYRSYCYPWTFRKSVYLPLKQIPKKTRTMILRVEDGSFYHHHGIVLGAIKNAWKVNQAIGKTVYGGSTITMQTARTLFLTPHKNYVRKYLELIIAIELEVILDKDRIFELYLNNAEWGKGVFGIEAASRHHFKKTVSALSRDETIRLVTLLSSPIVYTPQTLKKSRILAERYRYLSERF
ncbi:MAG: transglycosylase domain-containing protein [Spirochaetales bacterium]|nr:transglycosylase domain-containing protein [Spirochaetales bacterium]